MMCVPWELKESKIHGKGVFAKVHIPKDAVIWKFSPIVDKLITYEEMNSLPAFLQDYLRHYTYDNEEQYVLCGDDARYFNHSNTPNTFGIESADGFGQTIAARDIQPGEELTCDYEETDQDYERKKTENPFIEVK